MVVVHQYEGHAVVREGGDRRRRLVDAQPGSERAEARQSTGNAGGSRPMTAPAFVDDDGELGLGLRAGERGRARCRRSARGAAV